MYVLCSGDKVEMMCTGRASLWRSTAAVANTKVILVDSQSLFKESSCSSNSAWRRAKKCSAWGSQQQPTTRLQTLNLLQNIHVRANSIVQPCILSAVFCYFLGTYLFLILCHTVCLFMLYVQNEKTYYLSLIFATKPHYISFLENNVI